MESVQTHYGFGQCQAYTSSALLEALSNFNQLDANSATTRDKKIMGKQAYAEGILVITSPKKITHIPNVEEMANQAMNL
ncbi:hypothetical protein HYC85_028875 [Camellia sinensis]|uniref:Uncharacterized protein n=1 Tax=Camellia sinensis TaxID=4442 RepID=A0A7J7G0C0_CAMSI|nr:hypothetical protein HYC85_028875 [Camellia sinensis]